MARLNYLSRSAQGSPLKPVKEPRGKCGNCVSRKRVGNNFNFYLRNRKRVRAENSEVTLKTGFVGLAVTTYRPNQQQLITRQLCPRETSTMQFFCSPESQTKPRNGNWTLSGRLRTVTNQHVVVFLSAYILWPT